MTLQLPQLSAVLSVESTRCEQENNSFFPQRNMNETCSCRSLWMSIIAFLSWPWRRKKAKHRYRFDAFYTIKFKKISEKPKDFHVLITPINRLQKMTDSVNLISVTVRQLPGDIEAWTSLKLEIMTGNIKYLCCSPKRDFSQVWRNHNCPYSTVLEALNTLQTHTKKCIVQHECNMLSSVFELH